MNHFHRHRRRSETPPLGRSRSTSSHRQRRSTSSDRHGRHHDKQSSRQHYLDRHRERSKHEMMERHRHDAIIDKLGRNEGSIDSREVDPWVYLVASTCVVLASLVNTSKSSDGLATIQRRSMYLASLSLCSIQLSLVLFGTVYLLRVRFGNLRIGKRRQCRATLTVTLLALILQSGINYLLLRRRGYAIAPVGSSIVDHNMFYGCWVSFGLLSFLLGRGIASVFYNDEASFSQRRGAKSQMWRSRHQFAGKMTALWTMYLFFQVCSLSSSFSIRFSSVCGALLGSTTACRGVSASAVLSSFNIILCLMVLFLDKSVSFLRMRASGLVRLYGVLAFLSLILQAATTGILTSNGGMGCNPGNLYVSTWTNTVLIVIICLRCIDGYLASISPPPEESKEEKGHEVMAYPIKNHPLLIKSSRSVQKTVDTPSTESSDDDGAARRQQRLLQQGGQKAPQHRAPTPPPLALPAPPPPPRPTQTRDPVPKRPPPPPPRSQTRTARSREPPPTDQRPKADPQGSVRSRGRQERIQETAYYHSSSETVTPDWPGQQMALEPEDRSRKDPDAVTGSAKAPVKRRSSVDRNETTRRPQSKSRSGRDPSIFPSYNSIGNVVSEGVKEPQKASVTERTKPKSNHADLKDDSRRPRKASITEKPSHQLRKSSAKRNSDHAEPKDDDIVYAAASTERARSTLRQQRDPSAAAMSSFVANAIKEYDAVFKDKVEHHEPNVVEEAANVEPRMKASAYSLFDTVSAYDASIESVVPPSKPMPLNKQSSMPLTHQTSKVLASKRTKSLSQIDQTRNNGDVMMTVRTNFGEQSSRKSKGSMASTSRRSSLSSGVSSMFSEYSDAEPRTKISKQANNKKMLNESSYISLLFDDDDGNNEESVTPSDPESRNKIHATIAGSRAKRKNSILTQHDVESLSHATPSSARLVFNSEAEFDGVVAAALAAAKAVPPSTSSSEPAGTNEDDVETVSTNTDYKSYIDHASSHGLMDNINKQSSIKKKLLNEPQEDLPTEEEVSDKMKEHPLDFQYRPISSSHNFNAALSRREFAAEVVHSWRPQSAPVQTIETTETDSSDMSEPTIDQSIRTTKTSKLPTDSKNVDASIQAALNRANEVRRSRRLGESMGKITVEGRGEAGDVNEIVAAALHAASSKSRRHTNSMKEPPPPPPVAARRLDSMHNSMPPPPLDCRKKKSMSSNFSAEILNQQIAQKMQGRESKGKEHNESQTPRCENQSVQSFYSKTTSRASSESFALC